MSQTYETLVLERRERVAIITINRPEKRNALNIKTREEGAALLEELRSDNSVGVVDVFDRTFFDAKSYDDRSI